ncbi:Hypothetical predicted protein [Mytilus galloprovincialis]|uniref:SWIM-type domain-containing protein n=1 Tax=Mytilus galloprovincialis TaxID=29158 RepID=A0A8B6FFI0_MYTGA|nr:Hypothetical predicted protein [Mytilus galloprovincialis]
MNNLNPPGLDKITTWADDMRVWPNVMYGDVYNFLISSKAVDGQEMKNFKSLQSYNYFQSGNVGAITHHVYTDNTFLMRAEVRSSQTVSRMNSVYVHSTQDGTVKNGWCSCMAGRCHACSHVGALLWKLEHAVRNSLTGIACTDESAQWNKGTTRNVEPKALSNITFKKPKVGESVMDNNEDYVPSVRDTPLFSSDAEFKAAIKNSPISKLFEIKGTTVYKSFNCTPMSNVIIQEEHGEHTSISSCRKCYTFFNKYIELNDTKRKNLEHGTKGQSSSVLWKDARKLRITASSATKVPIKDTTDATSFIREHLHPKFTGNKYTRHGTQQEPVAKEHLRSLENTIIDTGMYVSTEEQWLSSSSDGILNGDTLLEVKCPVPTKWNTLEELINGGKYDVIKTTEGHYQIKVKGSRGYYMQIQLTMYCTGLRKGKLYLWRCPDDFILINVDYDQEYVREQVQRLKDFYVRKMIPRIVDEVDSDRLTFSRLFCNFMR